MAPVERDAPADRQLRHLHTSSTGALIPMWDSSDPDRAPPPLPLNPQSPSISPSKSGTSLAIQSAHAALAEKAREGEQTALVPALKKRMTMGELTTPPDQRALVSRPNNHKRMQSLQPGSVRDLSLMIEGARDSRSPTPKGSPDKHSPEKYLPERYPGSSRPGTPSRNRERDREPEREHRPVEHRPMDKENARPTTPTPMPISLNPAVRPSMARRAQQSILGESTPPQSATMLALQNMGGPLPREAEAHPPHAAAMNNSNSNSNPNSQAKGGASWDHLSGQIISLTSIATALQKEMSQLSRRSRDNATDLMSLKEATHARDEDIRKSLRELVANIDGVRSSRENHNRENHNRDTYSGGMYPESKAHSTSPISRNARPFSLPRIPSPHSFAASIDRESVLSTPSLVPSESPATIALLEKIIREMGTKDGQETVINQLTELAEKLAGMASSAKVEELISYMRAVSHDQSIVPASGGRGGGGGGTTRSRHVGFDDDDDGEPGPRELDWSDRNGTMTQRIEHQLATQQRPSSAPSRAGDLLNDDVLNVIRSVKDSVAQGGGMTAEVKALVRELRGEVLGMGRDIARKLDEVDASATNKNETPSKKDVSKIVEEGLDEMKLHMNQLLREHRRASASSLKSVVDYQEIYNAMRTALNDSRVDNKSEDADLTRDDVMDAVKDAWENYKPEIQVEQIGLERDEVLSCLKEGLQEYVSRQEPCQGATKDDVFQAIVEGMKHFTPPQVESPSSLSRDEVLEAVRECLEEFEFPIAPSAMNDLTKDDVLDAVQQGLKSFDFPDNSAAVVPHQDNSEVVDRLHDIMIFMQQEFRTVSEEAKQNIAASGRDTEQVLDATKDGLDQLRTHLESYIDRLASGTGQEELMSNLVNSFDSFREELSELVAHASDGSKEMIKEEIESLRDAVNSSLVPHVPPAPDNREALEALREGIERVRHELLRPHAGTTDILDALHEGFSDLREAVEKVVNKPADFTANDEILEALQEGLSTVRTEIDALREHDNEKAVVTVGGGPSDAMVPADMLKHDDIKNLEMMMTQLRIKMESLGSSHPPPETVSESGTDSTSVPTAPGGLRKEDLSEVEEMLRNVQEKVTSISNAEVEESLRNLHISVEAISNVEVQESIRNLQASVEAMSNVEVLEAIRSLQESVGGLALEGPRNKDDSEPINPDDVATKEDIQAIETILRNTKGRLEDILDGEQAVKKDHLDAVEAMVLETKDAMGALTGQLETISKKEDLVKIESLVTQVNIAFDEMKERSEKALEDPEKVTKTHVEAVEAAIVNIKSAIEESLKSDIATLSSKDDVKALETIVSELKDATTAQAEANDKALVDRRAEVAGVGDRVAEVKTFLEELQGLMKEKLEAGATGIDHLSGLLGGLSQTIGQNANVGQDLKEMLDIMKNEFEESKSGVIGAKLDTDEKFTQTTDVLSAKIDEKIGELITKYDMFQTVMEERTTAGEARDAEMEAAVVGTKAIADELKVLVDTLGSSVTDSLEKMEEASKTVFIQVEQLYTKSEENHTEDKSEHQTTRDQIQQAVNIVEGLQGHVTEFQPQILETVKNVLMVVGQHYEHSRNTASQLQKQIEDAKPEEPLMLPPPPEKYDDTEVLARLEKIAELAADKYSDAEVLAKLDKLAADKYDDAEVRGKLDKLVEEKYDDKEVITRLDKLAEDKYNDAEVLAKLNKLAEDKYDDKEVLARLQKLADEKYDDTEVLVRLEKLNEDLKYDDTDVLVRLEKLGEDLKYDDTEVLARLAKLDEDKYNDVEVLARLDKLAADKYDDAGVVTRLDQLVQDKYDDSQVQAKLNEIAEKCDPAEVHSKLNKIIESDDKAVVHSKLDKLVGHTEAAERAYEHLATLDRVHRQVQQTATDLTHFIAAQKKRVADEQEDYGRALQETRISLERSKAEKSEVESSLSRLRSEEAQLRAAVASLRNEQDDMLRRKARTAADIASLETALRLRREELHAMDARAEGLERRILEGVLDHSRALLMTKGSSSHAKNRGDVMSRKRVPGARSSLPPGGDANATTPTRSSVKKSAVVNMTRLTPKQNGASGGNAAAAANNRRILSLSQMSHNVPTGGVSRSQSVRTPGGAGGLRKSSWTPGGGVRAKKHGGLLQEEEAEDGGNGHGHDKENEGADHHHADSGHERLDEEEDEHDRDVDDADDAATEVVDRADDDDDRGYEGESVAASDPEDGDGDDDGDESESGTLRRTSLGTTTTTDDYDAASASDDYTESVGDSESIAGDPEVVMVSSAS
ncbi:hypothetical protein SLS62_002890 [Diatrype stigma]|uniref:Uncharacterized protein n=1 Tax=Diatrype stigma TaxID=117547 RepID=A0AAN9YV54_9PEZI